MPDNIQELVKLRRNSYLALRDGAFKYGRIGVQNTSGNWIIPSDEINTRYITVTLQDGTLLKDVDSRGVVSPGLEVRLSQISGRWVVEDQDQRNASSLTSVNANMAVPKHSHNIGYTSFYPIDTASINDGLVLPTGSGLNVQIGRVTYPKLDGTIGIYDDGDIVDLASGASGLTAITARWLVIYIDRNDGSVNIHLAPTETPPLNTTTHIEDAVADCLSTEPDAFPYLVVKMTAGLSVFGTYKPMSGLSVDNKDFIRLGFSGMGGTSSGGGTGTIGYPNPVTSTFTIPDGHTLLVKDSIEITTGSIVLGTGSVIKIFGNERRNVTTKTANYPITANDSYIRVDASGGAVTITLPDASTLEGQVFDVKAIDVSGGNVTVDTTSSQTIDGASSVTLTVQYESVSVISNGSDWDVI